jgi:hypothetical protein
MRRWQHIKQRSKERRAGCYPKQLRQGRNEKSYIGAAALGSHTQWLIESIYVADGRVNVYAAPFLFSLAKISEGFQRAIVLLRNSSPDRSWIVKATVDV